MLKLKRPDKWKKPTKTDMAVLAAAGAMVLFVVGMLFSGRPIIGENTTESMAPGLYLYSYWESPEIGDAVIFPMPQVVVEIAERQGIPRETGMLKPLIAGPGDHVCVTDELTVNGQRIAPVQKAGPTGNPMPVWEGCRKLEPDEWFPYASRIWNSVDGRSFGPIHAADIKAVAHPLWTWGD
jgi:type IV secretory pathway protease TraF